MYTYIYIYIHAHIHSGVHAEFADLFEQVSFVRDWIFLCVNRSV